MGGVDNPKWLLKVVLYSLVLYSFNPGIDPFLITPASLAMDSIPEDLIRDNSSSCKDSPSSKGIGLKLPPPSALYESIFLF